MKVISLHQPWASLCVTRQPIDPATFSTFGGGPMQMVKRFETRSWPCPPNLIGQRIALHVTQRGPDWGETGDYTVEPWYDNVRHVEDCCCEEDGIAPECARRSKSRPVLTKLAVHVADLPLGAIVGSAVIEACLPIVNDGTARNCVDVREHIGSAAMRVGGPDPAEVITNISAQLPYGDYTPGRYAWVVEDAAPTSERCPWCWGTGIHYQHALALGRCPVCLNKNRCDPIPARGHQRIWNWTP